MFINGSLSGGFNGSAPLTTLILRRPGRCPMTKPADIQHNLRLGIERIGDRAVASTKYRKGTARMTDALPEYYFRIRDNGAAVFKVDTENRHRRIEMEQIAVVNTNRGDFKAHGDHTLNAADNAAIADWLDQRMALLATRGMDDIHRTIDHLNLTTQWAQSKASDAELEDVTDKLLLAMHDLRSMLVRKKADRMTKG